MLQPRDRAQQVPALPAQIRGGAVVGRRFGPCARIRVELEPLVLAKQRPGEHAGEFFGGSGVDVVHFETPVRWGPLQDAGAGASERSTCNSTSSSTGLVR